ncbi:AcidPPc domain-containing protein [Aphelenchoides besseyi]|nr:AcidPPc domain-containing protein [Aphelenchoides besseyi]
MSSFDSRVSLAILRTWSRCVSNSRWPLLLLEWTAHGVPWLVGSAVLLGYFCRRPEYSAETRRKFALLTLGILFGSDRRWSLQTGNSTTTTAVQSRRSIADQFSFPSGHTSRAAMLAVLAIEFFPVRRFFGRLFVYTIPVLLGISRIAMGRHYFSDVIGGSKQPILFSSNL